MTEATGQDDVAAASVQRIREEIERITRRNMKDCVAAHLAQLCAGDPALARNVLSPQKSLAKCFRYISRKAREYAEQERSDGNVTDAGVYGCDIPDDIVYQWAVDYFNDPNADKEPRAEVIRQTGQGCDPARSSPSSRIRFPPRQARPMSRCPFWEVTGDEQS